MPNSKKLSSDSPVERIPSYTHIEPGQYWRSRIGDEANEITAGMVLLVLLVKQFERQDHTVVLKGHPGAHDEDTQIRYLIADFMREFEPALYGDQAVTNSRGVGRPV